MEPEKNKPVRYVFEQWIQQNGRERSIIVWEPEAGCPLLTIQQHPSEVIQSFHYREILVTLGNEQVSPLSKKITLKMNLVL